jgi:DNA polymerase-3 subunit delta'
MFHDALDDVPQPQTAARLLGHDGMLGDLLASHKAGRMHHAFMLMGERGAGKATLAFAFAHAALSAADPGASARIAAGTHGSVHHVRRSFNDQGRFRTEITIGDIQRMSHMLAHTADGAATRIIIVDSAGDMNASAANALLKNLEEPPPRTHFFLIVHTGERLLPTIRSRCRVLTVNPLPEADVAEVLRGFGFGDEEAREAAMRSGGSVREAILAARHGGADLAKAIDELVLSNPFKPTLGLAIAQAVSDRDAEQQYEMLMAMLEKRVAAKARAAALAGEGGSAHLARAHAELAEKRRIAEAYGLDRKLEILNLLRWLHPLLAA